jgi:hypothetical protein
LQEGQTESDANTHLAVPTLLPVLDLVDFFFGSGVIASILTEPGKLYKN